MDKNNQKLIDIIFSVALTLHGNFDEFKNMKNEEISSWVSKQLKDCGFETEPCGSSWGVLKKIDNTSTKEEIKNFILKLKEHRSDDMKQCDFLLNNKFEREAKYYQERMRIFDEIRMELEMVLDGDKKGIEAKFIF